MAQDPEIGNKVTATITGAVGEDSQSLDISARRVHL